MQTQWKLVLEELDERRRRIVAAALAKERGRGGISSVSAETGISRPTIRKGIKELESGEAFENTERVRNEGGGRKPITTYLPNIEEWVADLIEDFTYANPDSTRYYTSQSLRKIRHYLSADHGANVSYKTVAKILEKLECSRQANRKLQQVGEPHPDRNEQFEYINRKILACTVNDIPVISVDAKNKVNVGNFANKGTEYRYIEDARACLDHDFPIPELGKVTPYGVYCINNNTGFINLGISHDTSAFAVESLRRWWFSKGIQAFPDADKLYITCDNGGSNASNRRLWKLELQKLANELGLAIHVSHYPPGTSKFNKIERRLFSQISKNWAGKPLIDIPTIMKLISSTETTTGLTVTCQLDENTYETGIKISDQMNAELMAARTSCSVLGDWNYVVLPCSDTQLLCA